MNVECLAVTAFPQADPQNVTTGTDVLRPIAGRGVEKWVARLWNVREESGSEWLVVEVSSVIDIASGLLARVKVKSFDFDHNLHCALAEREGHSEDHVSGALQVWSGNPAAKHSRKSIFPPCLCASVRDLCIFSRRTIAARFTPEVLARLVAWDICPEVAVSVA